MADLERQRKAVELHLAGHTYAAIARTLGYGDTKAATTAAWKDVQRGLDNLGGKIDPTDTRSAIARLDAMLAGLWRAARSGDVFAVDRVLKIEERRDKIMALSNVSNGQVPVAADTGVVVELANRLAQRREAARSANT